MTRHNLCPNPSAKNNGTGYSGTASAARATGLSGFTRTTGMVAAGGGFIQSPTAPCAPGDQIVVSFQTISSTVLGTKTIYCAFTRSAGGDDFGQTFTVTADTTVRRAVFNGTAPANATGVYLLLDGIAAGTTMAAVMYEPGAVDGGYADGDSSGWAWDGASGNSASSESTGTDIPTAGTVTGSGSVTGTVTTSRPKSGTSSGSGALTSSVTSSRVSSGTSSGHGTLSGTSSGGDTVTTDGAAYDLEDVMEALAALFDGVPTGDTIDGSAITLECHAEVTEQVQAPSIVLEIDDLSYDLNMGHGADSWQVAVLVLVVEQDQDGAQRLLWRFLSRKPTSGLMRLKAVLEADQTLGDRVSYAVLQNVRNIGQVTYGGVDYLGAEMIIEVMS